MQPTRTLMSWDPLTKWGQCGIGKEGGEALRMWIDGVNESLVRCPRLLLLCDLSLSLTGERVWEMDRVISSWGGHDLWAFPCKRKTRSTYNRKNVRTLSLIAQKDVNYSDWCAFIMKNLDYLTQCPESDTDKPIHSLWTVANLEKIVQAQMKNSLSV